MADFLSGRTLSQMQSAIDNISLTPNTKVNIEGEEPTTLEDYVESKIPSSEWQLFATLSDMGFFNLPTSITTGDYKEVLIIYKTDRFQASCILPGAYMRDILNSDSDNIKFASVAGFDDDDALTLFYLMNHASDETNNVIWVTNDTGSEPTITTYIYIR